MALQVSISQPGREVFPNLRGFPCGTFGLPTLPFEPRWIFTMNVLFLLETRISDRFSLPGGLSVPLQRLWLLFCICTGIFACTGTLQSAISSFVVEILLPRRAELPNFDFSSVLHSCES